MPGGGPQGSSGTGTGSTANVYTPMAQPTADFNFQQLVQPFIDQGLSGSQAIGRATGGLGPAASSFPTAQDYVSRYLTANPYRDQAVNSAQDVARYGADTLFQMGANNAGGLSQAAGFGLPFAGQSLAQGFDPTFTNAISQIQNNPYYGQALSGAQDAAASDKANAEQLQRATDSVFASSTNPMYQQLTNFAQDNPFYSDAITGASYARDAGLQGAQQEFGAANQLLQTGFDPQSALFNRTQQQLMDQSQAANAAAGLGSSPYGASVTSNALGNFDINWQNNLLNRQTQAANAASPLFQNAPGLAASSGAAPGEVYTNQLNNIGNALNRQLGAGISGLNSIVPSYDKVASLQSSSSSLPSQVFTNHIGQVLNALRARNQAGVQGAAAYSSLLGGAGGGLAGAQNLGGTAANQFASTSLLPYQTGAGIASNALQGLGSLTNLGNSAYALPQQGVNDLESYLRLGQSASGLSGQLGNLGFNQTAQGLGGLIGGANALVGNNGLLTGSGGLGGLFGGGGGAGAAAGIEGLTDFGGGGAALGIPDAIGGAAAGGGDAIASALPFALSA